jgi:hypothetical protein
MNIVSDLRLRGAHRPELSNMTALSTEAMFSDTQRSCGASQETHRWKVFVTALERAQETLNPNDVRLAYAVWLDFLLAYLPDENRRSQIPVPAFFRGRL